jgi:hypothetical protein
MLPRARGGRRGRAAAGHRRRDSAGGPALSFTEDEEARGRDALRAMGLDPETDWFVCLFARDPVYLKNLLPD